MILLCRSQDRTDLPVSLQFSSYEYRNFQTPEERTLAAYQQFNNAFMDSLNRILLCVGRNYQELIAPLWPTPKNIKYLAFLPAFVISLKKKKMSSKGNSVSPLSDIDEEAFPPTFSLVLLSFTTSVPWEEKLIIKSKKILYLRTIIKGLHSTSRIFSTNRHNKWGGW